MNHKSETIQKALEVFAGSGYYISSPSQRICLYKSDQPEDLYSSLRLQTSPRLKTARNVKSRDMRQLNIFSIMKVRSIAQQFLRVLQISANLINFNFFDSRKIQIIYDLMDRNLQQSKTTNINCLSLPLLEVQSIVTLIWDLFFLIIVLASFVYYPVQISFELDFNLSFSISMVVCILLDILISVNRMQVQKGQLIKSRMKILSIYARKEFLSDFVSVVSLLLNLIAVNPLLQSLLIIFYLITKVRKISRIINNIIELYNLKSDMRDLIQLISMIFIIIFVIHFIACLWHGQAHFENQQDNWLIYYGYFQQPKMFQYQASFYWAAMTMTTVGYGDITPKNQNEMIIANITMIIACIIFGYTMNSIGMLLNSINSRDENYKKHKSILNIYLQKNGVNLELQSRIRSYIQFMQSQDNENDEMAQQLINKISPQLQGELEQELKGQLVRNSKVFKQYSKELLNEIVRAAIEIKYGPEEIIFQRGSYDDYSLFIIKQGRVKIETWTQELKCGDWFGEYSFYTNQPRGHTIRSVEYTELLKIQRSRFLDIIQKLPLDNEQFHLIKDGLLYSDTKGIGCRTCNFCNQDEHYLNDCNYLKLNLDRESIIKKCQFPHNQQRKSSGRLIYKTSQRRRTKSLLNVETQRLYALEIQKMIDEVSHSQLDESQNIEVQNSESINASGTISYPKLSMQFVTDNNEEEISPVLKKMSPGKIKILDNSTEEQSAGKKRDRKARGFTYARNQIEMDPIDEEDSYGSKHQSFSNSAKKRISLRAKPKTTMIKSRELSYLHRNQNPHSSLRISQQTLNNSGTLKNIMQTIQSYLSKLSGIPALGIHDSEKKLDSRRHLKLSSSAQQFRSQLDINNYSDVIQDFERMSIFSIYYPQFNYNIIMKKVNLCKKLDIKFSNYSFFANVISKTNRIKKNINVNYNLQRMEEQREIQLFNL